MVRRLTISDVFGVIYAVTLGLSEGPAQIACIGALVVLIGSKKASGWRPGRIEWGLMLWAGAGIFGAMATNAKLSTADTTRPLMALAMGFGMWGVAEASAEQRTRLARGFLLAMTLNGAYGIVQWTVGALPWDHWFLANPRSGQIYIPSRVFHERASSGLFYNRLRLAHAGMVALGLLGLIGTQPGIRRSGRILAWVGISVLGAGFVLTYARMAWVAFAGGALALALMKARMRTVVGLVGGTGAFAAALALTEYGRRRFTSLGEDGALRWAMYRTAARMMMDHPWVGVGHGVYTSTAERYAPASLGGTNLVNSHHLWLHVGAETGWVGLFGFVLAVGTIWVRSGRAVRQPNAPLIDQWVFLTLTGFMILGMAHFFLHHASVGLLFWTVAGIAAARGRPRSFAAH